MEFIFDIVNYLICGTLWYNWESQNS